jgi:hypothetical protein
MFGEFSGGGGAWRRAFCVSTIHDATIHATPVPLVTDRAGSALRANASAELALCQSDRLVA